MRGKHTEKHIFYTKYISDEQSSPVTGKTLGFSAQGPSAHHGLFAHALLQKQLLLFRAGPTMLPTPE